ncbi:hypothetical protein N0V83_003796 [Neocucurbitaria cava]|uniref:Uncharacterized protein n=1 Tax=Neocucurbitaria cava TaxID=798079 RepID=A0A9W9CNF3_9PLEO|nr:hypothetical protein N0V83_003796 [Neocucurbitaria cava]
MTIVHQKLCPKPGHEGLYCLKDEKIGCSACKAEHYAEQRRLQREAHEERERKRKEKEEKRQADQDRQGRRTGKK